MGARPLFVACAAACALAACTEPAPPPDCAPVGGGPYAVVEGDALSFAITCATPDEVRDGAEVTVGGLPAGAVYDPMTATVTWTPGLDQAAVYELTLAVAGEATAGAVRVSVADAFDTEGNVPPLDPLRYPDELGVPVLFLSPAPSTEEYEPVTVIYRGHTYAAEGKKRGASSLGYPKNSYTVKFAAGDHFEDPDHAGGFLDKKRIVLTSTFDDNTYVRQRLAYEVWNTMDAAHIPVQVYNASVYVDGEFWGLYLVSDHIDDNHFAAHGLAEAGNVYKAYNHDANFTLRQYDGDPKVTLHDGYEKKEGLPAAGTPGAWDDLDALVTFVANADAATFAAELPGRIDVRDFRDWFVFVTYVLGEDSAGKNCYLYHDPTAGPWRYVPWDFNHSFGQSWQTRRTDFDAWDEFRNKNRIFVRMLDDAYYRAALDNRYATLLTGALSDASVLALADAMLAETRAVAARDWRKWSDAYRSYSGWRTRTDFLGYDDEVAYLRQWILDRGAMLRERFPL